MSKINGSNGYQILSDGKSLALVWQEQGEDTAIFMSGYVMSQWTANIHQDTIEIDTAGGYREYMPESRSIQVDISLISSGECEYRTGKDLMLEMDLFSRMSVSDLFKVINKKINQR